MAKQKRSFMKKTLVTSLAFIILASSIVSCGNTATSSSASTSSAASSSSQVSSPSSSSAAKISVKLDKATISIHMGKTETLTATTTPAGKTVVWTSSDSGVASVSKTGVVTGVKIGTATITATTADALTATCAVTVLDEEVPTLPTDADVTEVGETVEKEDTIPTGYTIATDETSKVTKISWTAAAFASAGDTGSTGYWKNDADFRVKTGVDLTRKTKINFSLRTSAPISAYFKVCTEDWTTVKEGEFTISTSYKTISVDIPTANRYMLAEATRVLIYAPKPGTTADAGDVEVAHVYFSGDAEPMAAPGAYDPTTHDVIYDMPLTNAKKDGCFDDQTAGNVTWSINEAGEMVFVNTNFNGWAPFAFKTTEYDDDNKKIDYTGVENVVLKIKADENALIKMRPDWNGDLTELKIDATKANKWQYVALPLTSVVPLTTIVEIIPSYRVDGTKTGTINVTIASIQFVKAKAA
jgi:hypothetical protein